MATIDELAKKNALDAQTQSDRAAVGGVIDTIKDANQRAGRAIADVATMPIRGVVGAYDTAVVRPMRAAGINAGYLSPLVTPNGADPASATPFYDKIAAQDAAPAVKPNVTPGVSPTGGITGQTPPAVATLAASPIQTQAQQAAVAPVAATTSAIQKLGVRRQPLNVPLQQPQAAQQPVQQGIPAVGQNLPETPIAYVGYGGGNSTQVAYKDGKTAEIMQGQALPDDVKAFNLISQQAGQQGGNVNVMRGVPETYNKDGTMRSAGGVQQTLALPAKPGEAFMREVPVELGGSIAAIGKYQAAQSQNAVNAADPYAAATAQELAKVGLQNEGRLADAKIQAGATTGSAAIRADADRYGTDVGAKTNIALEASRAASKTEKSETGKWSPIAGEPGGKPEFMMNTATGEVKPMAASAATQQLPPGMKKYLGKSGGKPVYENKDGKQVIGK